MFDIDIKDFVPVFATVLGGALTTFGGFMGAYILQKNNKVAERRSRLLNYSEELYSLCDKIITENNNKIKEATFVIDERFQSDKEAFDRLSMLISLYFPNLCAQRDNLLNARRNFAVAAISYYKEVIKTNKTQAEMFSEVLGPPYIAVEEECVILKSRIVKEVDKYLSISK